MYRWSTSSAPSPAEPRPAGPRPAEPRPVGPRPAPTQTKQPRSRDIHVRECTKYALPKKMAFVGLKICALALFLLLGAAAEDERKPNIIFMLMDDVS